MTGPPEIDLLTVAADALGGRVCFEGPPSPGQIVVEADARIDRDPRQIDALDRSIGAIGQLVPALARRDRDTGALVVRDGVTRLHACLKGRHPFTLAVVEGDGADDLAVTYAANTMRRSLSTLAVARALEFEMARGGGRTLEQAAARVGVPMSRASKVMKAVGVLTPLELKALADAGKGLSFQHALADLKPLAGGEFPSYLEAVLDGRLGRDDLLARCRKLKAGRGKGGGPKGFKAATRGGLSLTLPAADPEAVIAELGFVQSGIRKLIKEGLPFTRKNLEAVLRSSQGD